ncbi:MAK10-like protein [Tanacetum coccineum]|uniref:MAK10-like protein n=1 Tax=Tanacetum coccineum TaxID=301880 RepID=A0ABQ5DVM6_9ASTR
MSTDKESSAARTDNRPPMLVEEESWAILENLALYDNESWNDPRDFAKPVKAITLPQDVPSTSDRRLIKLETQVQRLMEAHLAPTQPTQVNKITTSCEICSGPHDTQTCMENPKQAFVEYGSSRTDEAGGKWYTFKPEQNNLGDTYNPSWRSHPNLRWKQPQNSQNNFSNPPNRFQPNGSVPNRPFNNRPQNFNSQSSIEGLVSEFMASQDARLSRFEADFKQQQNEMTNKIDTVLKAITNQIAGILPSDSFINIGLLEETDHIFGLADGTKSYPVRIVKEVEVHIGKLKLLNDFYLLDMKKDLETPLLVGRGFLATANAVIDCRMAKITVGEGITSTDGIGAKPPYYARKDFLDCHLPGEWEISRDVELNPFKDTLVFRRMVEFLGAIPINLKCNMWESENLIEKPIDWNKPPKNRDGAWHAKIRLINPDGEEFTKTLQSIPTTRKLFKKENPREIIELDHFYDT